MLAYIALIHKEPASDYGVSFPDLPGCITAGTSLDDARDMAAEALALHLEGLATDGDAIPEPSSLDTVMADAANRDAVAILVDAPRTPVKSERLKLSPAATLIEQIDRRAEAQGLTHYGFLSRAARRRAFETTP
jgi:predicted RNase H-like HicB family nuclease